MAHWITKSIIIVVFVLVFMGMMDTILQSMDERGNDAATRFNDYQRWFDSLDRTKQNVDISLGDALRVRCFGDDDEKQAAWDKDWRSQYPLWNAVTSGMMVSSPIPEIWCDLRQDKNGNIIFPPHVMGHEPIHLLRMKDPRIADPDTFIRNDIYR